MTVTKNSFALIALLPLMAGLANGAVTTPARSPEQVYGQVCAHCHEARIGPVLKGRALPAEVVKHFVRYGNGAMPAWRPTDVSNEELMRLAEWIQTTPDGKEASRAAP